jgi:hypothetical protein
MKIKNQIVMNGESGDAKDAYFKKMLKIRESNEVLLQK